MSYLATSPIIEDRGGGGTEQAFPQGDRMRMPEPRLHQVERLHNNQIGRDQRAVIGLEEGHGGGMMPIGPVHQGEVRGRVDEEAARRGGHRARRAP